MKDTDWPIYYRDRLIVSNADSNVALVTLWTPKEIITSKLDLSKVSIAGQLYSKRGVNFLLRNILANPRINTIIICGADRSGSADALVNLVMNGIDEDYKILNVSHSEIHKEIDRDSINKFRANIKMIDYRNKINIESIQLAIEENYIPESKWWSKKKLFKDQETISKETMTSEKTSFMIRAEYIKDAWPQMLEHVLKFGSEKGMINVGSVRELVNLVVTITDDDPDNPELIDDFGFDMQDLESYYKEFFSKDKGTQDYTYGNRLNKYTVADHEINQLKTIYEKLKSYKYDRGAIGLTWNAFEDNEAFSNKTSKNVPCLNYIQFIYRNKKLHLNAYFRSNDTYAAWPRNAFGLRKLQYAMANKLKMRVGHLTTFLALSQVYENDLAEAKAIVDRFKASTFCVQDERTSIIIEIIDDQIVAKVMSPDGNQQIGEIKEEAKHFKSSSRLMDKLVRNFYFQNQYHTADIAMELTKAEICYKNNMQYVQDKSWEELMKLNI